MKFIRPDRILLLVTAFMALLTTGCTMHPPSAAGFMEAIETAKSDNEDFRIYSGRIEHIRYNMSDDEWEMPVALETTRGYNGTHYAGVTGWGLLPSPYFMLGAGTPYYGIRTWISSLWLTPIFLQAAKVSCLFTEDDVESCYDEEESSDDEEDSYDMEDIGNTFKLFAGGASIVLQAPIGRHVRIGIEGFVARNVWVTKLDQEDFSNAEIGYGGYASVRIASHRFSLEARHSYVDFKFKKTRLTLAIVYNYIGSTL